MKQALFLSMLIICGANIFAQNYVVINSKDSIVDTSKVGLLDLNIEKAISTNFISVGSTNSSKVEYAYEGNIFLILKIIITNTGDKKCDFNLSRAYIKDKDGRKHFFYRLNSPSSSQIKLKPKKDLCRFPIFQIPKDKAPYTLVIGENEITVPAKLITM